VVIGSHGRHGVQLLLGSTANAVHGASCDVLAVRMYVIAVGQIRKHTPDGAGELV